MVNNITTVLFEPDAKYATAYGLWQYNYGQVLRIQGLNLPKAVEIHFSLTESSGDSITRIGTTKDGATDVIIPDSMLENGDTGQNYNIYAFIFLSEIDSGNTEYRIKISVKARPKPEIPGTPEEPELFRETINAVNDAADRAETAERNAKVSEEAAAEHAKKTESSVTELDTAKEKALKAIDDKKAEGVNAVVKQKETSEQSVTEHTDREIQRVTQKANEINNSLNKSITEASNKKSALDESVNTSVETKKQLDLSIESGKKTKADLDQSIENSKNAKSNLDGSVEEANTIKTELAEAVETASTLDGSLGIKIEEGKQVQKNIVVSGEKAVEDINTTGAEKLKVMQDIAEEFAADREQIDTNKNNISSLKEGITSKADKTSLAQTDRKLDALWKLNQGISYEFQTDGTEAYQKTVPSGAKMASVKSIGGKNIAWNQIFKNTITKNGLTSFAMQEDGTICISNTTQNTWINFSDINDLQNRAHKYYAKFTIVENPNNISMYFGNLNRQSRTATITKGSTSAIFDQTQQMIDDGRGQGLAGFNKNTVFDGVKIKIICIDLTLMFGKGNEPATATEFEAMFPADYYPYNAGELMSAPIDEVIEHGKNYFDFSKLVSDGVNVMDYDNQTITVPSRTNNTGYNQTLRDLCPGITPGTYVFSMKRSNPESNAGSYFLEANKDFPLDKPTELTDEILNSHIAWYNNENSNIENVISEIQIEKNSAKTLYSQYCQKSHKIPQAILNLDGYGESGNFVDFVEKKYHKGDRIIDISDIIGDTFQEPLEVEAGGTLTFKNSHGDDYRIPVPSSEEYVISLAEVEK